MNFFRFFSKNIYFYVTLNRIYGSIVYEASLISFNENVKKKQAKNK